MRNWEGRRQRRKTFFLGEKQKEQRGSKGGEEPVEQIKGRRGSQEGWVHSPRVHPGIVVCQHRARAGKTSAISYQTHVTCLLMCSTNQLRAYLCSAPVLAAEILAWDQTLDEAGVVIHIMFGVSKEQALSGQPRHPADLHSRQQEHRNTHNKVVCSFSNFMDQFLWHNMKSL